MRKEAVFVGVLTLIVIQAYPAMGTLVEVSVTTDKPTYLLGEKVVVSVVAFNPNDYEVTIDFTHIAEATYVMDGIYNWLDGRIFIMVMPGSRDVPALSTYTWNLEHNRTPPVHLGDPDYYPLEVGVHSVVGEVLTDPIIQSEPFEFTVVPEPATGVLLSLGGLLAFARRRTKRQD